jgi:hypothetical protein
VFPERDVGAIGLPRRRRHSITIQRDVLPGSGRCLVKPSDDGEGDDATVSASRGASESSRRRDHDVRAVDGAAEVPDEVSPAIAGDIGDVKREA